MKHLQLLFIMMMLCVGFAQAQDVTLESLKTMQAEKQAAADALAGEAAGLQKQIDEFPGWKFGGFGTVGFNGLINNDWFVLSAPNSQQGAINVGVGGYARQDQPGYFWHNSLGVNVARLSSFSDKDDDNSQAVTLTNNAIDFTSLFGKKIAPKWAISAELKWISTVIERTEDLTTPLGETYGIGFNNPGQAIISAGVTWLPITNLTVNFHPLGFQKNWPGTLESNLGCKIGASYIAEILPGVAWKSDLTAFVPYGASGDAQALAYAGEDADTATGSLTYGQSDLTNWTWINSFSFNIFKGIGAKLDVGLGQNGQQANSAIFSATAPGTTLGIANPMQSYIGLGLGYTFL